MASVATSEEIKNLLKKATVIWEQAPEGVKSAAPGVISSATEIITTGILYINEIAPLDKISQYLDPKLCLSADAARDCVNNATHTFVTQNKDALQQILTSTGEPCSEFLKKGIEGALREVSTKILVTGIVTSGLLAIVEGCKLIGFWGTIKDARNLVDKSKRARGRIEEGLAELPMYFTRLDKCFAKLKQVGITDVEFEGTKDFANLTVGEIRTRLQTVLNSIGTLQVEVDGQVQKLSSARKSAVGSAVSLTASTASSIVNVALLGKFAHPAVGIVMGGLALLTAALGVGFVTMGIISTKDLEKLKTELGHIEDLRATALQVEVKLREQANQMNFMALSRAQGKGFDVSQFM